MPVSNSLRNKALLIAILASMLFGCFNIEKVDDGTNGEGGNDKPVIKISMSGKVADGYLAGARVCLDLNSNKVCNQDEPSTTSTDGGEYSLDGVTEAQRDSAPLLVEIIAGETVDEDNPGVAIDKKYTLTAPAGYSFISPLTTMVQSEIEESGLSLEEAAGLVKAKLGTTLDLEADYVAGSESGADADEFARLHKVAQVTVVVLQNNIELVEEVLANEDVSFEDLVGLIVSQVSDSLDTISGEVTSAGENFDPATVAESDEVDSANVDPATVEEEVSEREAARLITTVNIAAVLASGDSLHFFDGDERHSGLEFSYGSISLDTDNAVNITETFSEGNSWIPDTDSHDNAYQMCVLANGAWNCVNENSETISIDGETVIVKTGGLEATRSEITGVSVDLSGKRIQSFLDDEAFLRVTDPKAYFSAGSTGYKFSFKRLQNMFAIFKDNASDVTECWQDGDEQPRAIEIGQPYNPTDTWCNNAFIRTGDGDHSTDGIAARTLAQLISATAAVNPTDSSQIKGTSIHGRDLEIMAEFITGGTANFYVIKHNYNQEQGQQSMIENKIVGNWKEEVVDGKTLLSFILPPVLAIQGMLDNDEHAQFFTVEDGYVRRGGIELASERGDKEWLFNNTGRDQVLAAFNSSLLTNLTPCHTGDVDFHTDGTASGLGATVTEFVEAASSCNTINFVANNLVGTTFVVDFGFLDFKAAGEGVFLGEVGDRMNTVLNFTWTIDANGHVVVNTSAVGKEEPIHMRLTLAKIEENARQISLKSFSQEAGTAAGLDSVKGNIEGEVWGLN